jgi:hypothetical protein
MDAITTAYHTMIKEENTMLEEVRKKRGKKDEKKEKKCMKEEAPPVAPAPVKKIAIELDPLDHQIIAGVLSGQKVMPEHQARVQELAKWIAGLK